MSSSFQSSGEPQFIVVPFTGLQICRRVPLQQFKSLSKDGQDILMKAGQLLSEKTKLLNPLTAIISKHIACDDNIETTGWISLNQNDAAFFRLIRFNNYLSADLVIDTHSGPGRTDFNMVPCFIEGGNVFKKTKYNIGNFYTEVNSKPKNILGTFVMDFGNSGTSCIFAPDDVKVLDVRPIYIHNPFDPKDGDPTIRPVADKNILKSSAFLLTVPQSAMMPPWLVLGKRAEELIGRTDPLITSFYAPKKYVRHWPENLKDFEPTVPFRGLLGQRSGLFSAIQFVEMVLDTIINNSISSLVNPNFSSIVPDMYPQIGRILLTYPLTWRTEDKECFIKMIRTVADRMLVIPEKVREHFTIEFVCSEPVAVAAYALWESFLHFYHMAPNGAFLRTPSLASSQFGNLEGEQNLRLLVVDVGGGSSDIALVQAKWTVEDSNETKDGCVNVSFILEESLRFNRAGDRISHILVTAIWTYLSDKYKINETIDFKIPSINQGFTLEIKRQFISKLNELVELAKRHISKPMDNKSGGSLDWILHKDDEEELCSLLTPIINRPEVMVCTSFSVGLNCLQKWIEADYGSAKTRGEPGLMDIFFYLQELSEALRNDKRFPHMLILSGRTTRLPFFKSLTAKYFGIPRHRIRTLSEMIPDSLKGPDHENMDKLAVVYGAHRFRYGSPINFRYQKSESSNIFHRYIGTISNTPQGLRLNRIFVKPGETSPRTCKLKLPGKSSVKIGHSFRSNGRVEVLASLNNQNVEDKEIEFDLIDDYHVEKKANPQNLNVSLDEWVPGGTTNIVDNFNDTGRIDCEPDGFLKSIVLKNRDEWIK